MVKPEMFMSSVTSAPFWENVFKIGMTRRMDPQDRVDELGSASVPFKFDVHSFIFSDDAVSLENKLHTILNE